jgi:NAD-dependent SIR2 family protein deacetylase
MGDKKYLLLQSNYSVAYTDFAYFENNIERHKESDEKREYREIAEDLKQQFYNSFLRKHYKNIVVLAAAGTSLDNGINSGKTRDGLWVFCHDEIEAFDGKIPDFKSKPFYPQKDIEELLSYVMLFEKLNDGLKSDVEKLRKSLELKIKNACTLELDDNAPHKIFLDKITARKPSDSRVQLFTTNYDTLFEQAANKGNFVIIDGFSFTQPREFSGRFFDYDIVNREKTRVKHEESFITKVFHLCKLHGSLDWIKDRDKITQRSNPIDPLIVYPAKEKYESSYEQPYFEMMSRFQQALRKENTLLIVIGFGFQDKHIQNVIIEAVEQNPSFQLLIVNYNGNGGIEARCLESFFRNINEMEVKRNVNIVFETFGGFTKSYPENKTYSNTLKNSDNETILS